jgi:uncharacterized circularly permuted ATP-grasp superfamily protein
MVMYYKDYDTEGFFDEYFHPDGSPRDGASILLKRLEQLPGGELLRRQKATEARLFQMGVTFTVYGEEEGTERIFPFDIIPRVIESREWESLEKGLKQRIYALNLFIDDVYNGKKIIKDGIIPEELLKTSKCYRPQCEGFTPPRGVWCHISGTDLVRGGDGVYYVLEDNLRCPSGVSYVLENREVLKRTFPRIFEDLKIRPVDDYPYRLREMLQYMAPDGLNSPTVALLTPGIYNSAYFEHSFLAQQMGIELVEGGDLVVSDGYVYMKTTKGLQKVDVIYRRIDDDFIDPLAFREDSLLGVPGIMDVYKSGRIALVNAIGTGIADDKIIYAYVPKIIKYYTGEDPILPNVPTYVCWEELDRKYVVENLESLVVKPANESGGYGIMIGPKVSASVREEFRLKILADPRNYIAQPTVSLSRVPILAGERFEGRHVDFRPYTLYGEDIYVMPGGLTRVALKKGSLVVNSSQGGGSKDTWVLRDTP